MSIDRDSGGRASSTAPSSTGSTAPSCGRSGRGSATTCTSRPSATARGRAPRSCTPPNGTRLMSAPLLSTAVVGSYSIPGWLERVKSDFLQRRMSRHDFDESVIRAKMPTASLGLVEDFRFLRRFTERQPKVSVTGPHSLVKRIRNEYYPSEEAFALDIARVMNLELRELVRAGATYLQIDEPYYSGFPEDLPWGINAINALVEGVEARLSLHICYGNRYGKPSWEGSYRYLFPAINAARVQQLTLEFGRRGEDDVRLFQEFDPPFALGLGVIDVKTHDVESPAIVAERIRKALEIVPAERLHVNPDCGCLHLPRDVAFAKLCAMVEGVRIGRREPGA